MNAETRILITGSAGFIGSNVLKKFKDLELPVWGVDNYSTYYARSMKTQREYEMGLIGVTIDSDISDPAQLVQVFEKVKPTVVINLAAQGGVRASRINPAPYLHSNQVGFLNLIEMSKRFEVSKFIYASSSSVYGDSELAPFKESSPLPAPKSLYALSKISNEIIARDFASPGMEKIGLRFFTVYGPWGRPDMAIFRILASARLQKEFVLTASPEVKRDFTFVDDVSSVIEYLTRNVAARDEHQVINVAGGNPYSLAELFRILEGMDLNLNIRMGDADSLDVKLTHASVEKLESLGIPVPNTSLTQGVEKTLDWLKTIDDTKLREWFDYNS
jgi:UDP-glucuronate 4-epimerase